jgi:hypothetical protein
MCKIYVLCDETKSSVTSVSGKLYSRFAASVNRLKLFTIFRYKATQQHTLGDKIC